MLCLLQEEAVVYEQKQKRDVSSRSVALRVGTPALKENHRSCLDLLVAPGLSLSPGE